MDYCEKIFGLKKELIPPEIYKTKIDELFTKSLSCSTLTGLEFLCNPKVIDQVDLLDKERLLDFLLNSDDFEYFKELRIELIMRYAGLKLMVVQSMDNPDTDTQTYLDIRSN